MESVKFKIFVVDLKGAVRYLNLYISTSSIKFILIKSIILDLDIFYLREGKL